nr:MAG: hypothetical protein CSB23_02310 [Deltaproteobacteria bacterium]
MTEKTRVITFNILLDGTGNNRRKDAPKGQESNVSRIGEQLKADYNFDVSEGLSGNSDFASSLDKMEGGKVGNRDALREFIKSNDSSSQTINAYYDGVASWGEKDSLGMRLDGATGSGADKRVEFFVNALKDMRGANPDAEIRCNIVGGSRGAAEAKDLVNKLSSQDHSNISVNKMVLLDTVSSMDIPLTPAHSGMEMDYNPALIADPANVQEIFSLTETRDSFALTMYQQEGVKTVSVPGAHAQQVGGYANDLLAYVPFSIALNHLGQKTATSEAVELSPLSLEQTVRIAFSHIILENPYLTRAFLIDSRIKFDDSLGPANGPFEGEIQQERPFDAATDARRIFDESQVNDDSEAVSLLKDLFSGLTEMFSGEQPERLAWTREHWPQHSEFIENLERHLPEVRGALEMPPNSASIPPAISGILEAFRDAARSVGEGITDDNEFIKMQEGGQALADIFSAIREQIADSESGLTDEERDLLDEIFAVGSKKSEQLVEEAAAEDEEIRNPEFGEIFVAGNDEAILERQNDGYISYMQSLHDLSQAIAGDNSFEQAGAVVSFLQSLENQLDGHDKGNLKNIRNGQGDSNEAGVLDETDEALLGIVSSALSLGEAISKDESELEIAKSSLELVQAIDNYSNKQALNDNFPETNSDTAGLTNHQAENVGKLLAGINLAIAIEEGDDIDTAIAAVSLVDSFSDSFSNTSLLGDITTALSFVQDISSLDDAFESGNFGEIAYSLTNTVYHGIETYNAGMSLMGETSALANVNMVGVGAVIGVAVGLAQMLDGDVQAGEEQIALSIASYALSCIPVYGWIAAAALQAASALRGCDGRIIDKENVVDFMDDIAPAGGALADAAFFGVESASEFGNNIYEAGRQISLWNSDFYADQGIELHDGTKNFLNFFQTHGDAGNPFRLAHYSEDVEDMTLSDLWDGLYISQSLASTNEFIGHFREAIVDTVDNLDELAEGAIKAAVSPQTGIDFVKTIFGADDPPEGHADFSITNGVVTFSVGGDSAMSAKTTKMAEHIQGTMQSYLDGGGRIELAGEKMPRLSVEEGSSPCMDYGTEGGGNIQVALDPANLSGWVQGVLSARERGADLSLAINQSQLAGGGVDFARVDAILAGLGYVKNGINYSYGEHTELAVSTTGTGIFAGGGSTGAPEGGVITARQADLNVLPLRAEQLPQRTLGRLTGNIDVGSNLLGAGSSLFAAALMAIGLTENQAEAAESTSFAAEVPEDALPLDAVRAEAYTRGEWSPPAADREGAVADQEEVFLDMGSDAQSLAAFVDGQWDGLRFYAASTPGSSGNSEETPQVTDTAFFRELDIGGPPPATVSVQEVLPGADGGDARLAFSPAIDGQGALPKGLSPEPAALPELPADVARGTVFHMLEDGSLRFVADQLLAEPGTAAQTSDVGEFVGFGKTDHGRLSVDENGDYRFTPDADFTGYASFRYFVRDKDGIEQEREAGVYVAPQNQAPVVVDDEAFLQQGEVFFLDQLLANDSDADGDSLRLLRFSEPGHGSFTTIDGRAAYVAERDFYGTVDFTYWVEEERAGAAVWPVAGHAVLHYAEDGQSAAAERPLSNVAVASQTEGEDFVSAPQTGSFAADAGSSFLSPLGGGEQELPLDMDGGLSSGGAAPAAPADPVVYSLDTLEDASVTIGIEAVLQEGFVGADEPLFSAVGDAAHGSVRVDGDKILFTPDADYFGDDAGFVVETRTSSGEVERGWVTVAVEGVADAMEVLADHLYLSEDQPLVFDAQTLSSLLKEADETGVTLQSVRTDSTHGELVEEAGVFRFIPEKDWYGDVRFEYQAVAGDGEEITGQLYASFFPENDSPEADIYRYSDGLEDQEVLIAVEDLMAGARDTEDADGLRFAGIQSVVNGNAWVDEDDVIHLQPHADFYGTAALSYRIVDSEGGVGLGYGMFDFAEINDAPVASDNRLIAWSNNSYENIYDSRVLLANDVDVDGDSLRIVSVGQGQYGSVSLDAQGMLHYSSFNGERVGSDSFTYRIADGRGGESEAVVHVDVRLNSSPVLSSEILQGREDGVLLLEQNTLLANDRDPDGDLLQITEVGNGQHCQVSLLDDGSIQIVPEYNYNNLYVETYGDVRFEYVVSDGVSQAVRSVALVDLEAVNDAPIVQDVVLSGAVEDNSYDFSLEQLLAGSFDVEAASAVETDHIVFNGIVGAEHGSVRALGGDMYRYTPADDFYGMESIFYLVSDDYGAQTLGQTLVAVAGVNDRPVVQYDRNNSYVEDSIWNRLSIGQLLSNDFDADGDRLSAENFHITKGRGDITVHDGTLLVRPAFRQSSLEISYDVVDGQGGSTPSKLFINNIHEHNFAPTFSGLYGIDWKDNGEDTVWFTFHAEDKNGGNSWGGSENYGEIVSIAPSHSTGGNISHYGGPDPFTYVLRHATHTTFTLTVMDVHGATSSIWVSIDGIVGRHGRSDGIFMYSPVVIDLDDDGIELVDISAGVRFDWNSDGQRELSGWTSGDDAFLVYDYNGDGLVTMADELSFLNYKEGATTDLEGLQGFDSSGDGLFSAEDEAWNDFALWQDKNSNGITDEGELVSIEESDLLSINLQSDGERGEVAENILFGTTTATTKDGESLKVGDVALAGEDLELQEVSDGDLEDSTGLTDLEDEDLAESEADDSFADPDDSALGIDVDVVGVDSTDDGSGSSSDDLVLPFDDSSLNNQVDQLVSDMAASTAGETSLSGAESLESVGLVDVGDTSHEDSNGITTDEILAVA